MEIQSVHGQISIIASKTPAKIAIAMGGRKITYGELEEKASQIANFLHTKTNLQNIPVLLENGVELIEAILGVMKGGGVFAPIDPEFPENRIKLMLSEIDADWVITRPQWLPKLDQMMQGENRKINVLVLGMTANTANTVFSNLNVCFFESNCSEECQVPVEVTNKHCYIYFTSGSTGKPKAILGRQRSLKHFIDWEIGEFGVDETFRVSQLISPSFDPFLRDVFVPLCAGGTLCIPESRDVVLYPQRLKEWLEESRVNLVHSVPTIFKALLAELEDGKSFPHLQYILLAGELLRGNDVKKFFELFDTRIQLVNIYGPTETTLAKLFYRVQASDAQRVAVPVGQPIPGAQVLILDEDRQKCPDGAVGEIYIRTPYITSGYYNDRELMKQVFIPNPFSDNPQDIIYKTGDLGRRLASGDIEILGRVDHQVKLRGVRIELGEIENQLLKLSAVKEAVVVAREDQEGNKFLCAYVISDRQLAITELKERLAKELPDVMVPAYFTQLAELPLTPNGKIDRKALPEPEIGNNVEYVPPATPLEETLAKIWAQVLRVDRVGVKHNFFDLGGHSIKATAIVTRIHKELNKEVPLKDIFLNPTIQQLAASMETEVESIYASIKPAAEQEYYPVSSAQRRLYVLNQLERSVSTYNLPRILMVSGQLDREKLEASVKALISRHETLRTSFHSIAGEIVQKVHPEINFPINYSIASESEVSLAVKRFFQPFNLEKAPLMRVGVIQLAVDKHVLLFDMHHIVSDGSSMDILVRDFVALYEGQELSALPIQYKDFACWQNELFTSGAIEKQERYWLDTFSGTIPVLNLPYDYPRPVVQSFEGDRVVFRADELLTRRLNTLAKANGITLYNVLLAAYNVLLAKYSGQDDIVVGSPNAGRSHVDLENIIGMFINTLPLRNYPKDELTFQVFIRQVAANALMAFDNQDYQFEQLVSKLNVPRDLSRNPLFDVLFNMHNYEHVDLAIAGLNFQLYPMENLPSKFDLTFGVEEIQDQIGFTVEYCTKLFKRETVERMGQHYLHILRQVADRVAIRLGEIDMLLPEEKERICREFNATASEYAREKTIHQLFEEQVAKTPDSIALVFEDQQLTYREFNARANQLARLLRKQGVQLETVVALMIERSLEMLIGIYGILKAGAAYLPIDPDYPIDRVKYVLEDSQANMILTDKRLVAEGGLIVDTKTICLDEPELYQGDATNLAPLSTPENLAYMIYTSGSTGKPKGVMIEHRSVTNFIKGITECIEFAPESSILALTTVSFDIFGLETLLPLTRGMKVVIATDEHQRDTRALNIVITRENIDMLQMTPSRMRMLLNDEQSVSCLKNVKTIMLGGEALPQALLEEVKTVTSARIYNMYGPTETTIWSTVKELTKASEVTIGRPIANTQVYILGQNNNLQPIGVLGELCIAGEGLARGYWQRPEMTAEKFVVTPQFDQQVGNAPAQRMYRTGDRARWLPNGELECFGRVDDQVKIRGFRIELGEIENQLLRHDAVKEVAVVAKADHSGGKYLCAYLVVEGELHIPELKAYLGKELPDYMIPTYFIQLDALPYTPNGKIDRKALPEPNAGMVSGVEYVAPTTEIEEKLVKIWQEVLGIEGIGIQHNFFEIGGNSINIMKVISLISKRMGISVPMGELFLHPTIAELANNMFIANPMEGFECLVRLNKPAPGHQNIFILHTWEGIVYQYKEIAKQLEGEYNVFGVQAKGVTRPARLPKTLEEMITDYIVEIKAVQPEGPYIIIGYCYGNWIGYKMVEMLEDENVPIERFILIDENAWMRDEQRKMYKVRTVVTAPYRFLRKWTKKLILDRKKNPMDAWPTLAEYRKQNPPAEGEIKNDRTVRENVNILCGAGFRLNHLISTDVYIIKAEENNLVRYTPEDWRKQTSGKVWFEEIPGGHESIFNYPYVDELVRMIKRALVE